MSEQQPQMEPPQQLRLAIADPGSFVARERTHGASGDEYEPLVRWQARAVMSWLMGTDHRAADEAALIESLERAYHDQNSPDGQR